MKCKFKLIYLNVDDILLLMMSGMIFLSKIFLNLNIKLKKKDIYQ